MKNSNLSLNSIKHSVVYTLHRFHVILFVIIVIGGLAAVVFALNTILVVSSTPDGYASSSNNDTFDSQTIDRIKTLRQPGEGGQPLDLSGRSNPFVE
ncbi:MAG TPA: hypothetical protein VJ841_00525 [Candidatus Saccharimonadales bacterium]|nr:hypothetical protein [Candidatus Saccharimonadales bacterium]